MTIPTHTSTIFVKNSPDGPMNTDLGSPDSTFEIIKQPVDLAPGEVLVKNLYISNDPVQRVWIQKDIPEAAVYIPPIKAGEPMQCYSVVQVLKSNNANYTPGDLVPTMSKWGDTVVLSSMMGSKIMNSLGFSFTDYLDTVGGTGLAAYFGLFEVAKLKKSDVLVVSGASGATGSMTIQIAKKIIGAKKVIGIAGGKAKCDYVKSLGADECVDYKDGDFVHNMTKALDGEECDVFFDGVGGKILDDMMLLVRRHGTIIACGSVSSYNTTDSGVQNWGCITMRRLHVQGFVLLDYFKDFFKATLWMWWYIKRGYIKVDSSQTELVDLTRESDAVNQIPVVFNKLFNGEKKNGKLVTKLSDPVPV